MAAAYLLFGPLLCNYHVAQTVSTADAGNRLGDSLWRCSTVPLAYKEMSNVDVYRQALVPVQLIVQGAKNLNSHPQASFEVAYRISTKCFHGC